MTGVLTTLGAKAAERWIALLALPGALFLAFVAATRLMRDGRLFDVSPVVAELSRPHRPAASLVLLAAAVLVGAAGAGFVAQGLGALVQRLWFATRLGPPGWALTALRRWWWKRADDAYGDELVASDPDMRKLNLLLAKRDRICPVQPDRPLWMADRLRAVGERVHVTYGLDLGSLWPRLWLVVPDGVRTELSSARARLTDDARLCAWGLMYLVPALWWWPSAVIAVGTCVVAWRRGRASCDTLSDLIESAVDLHAGAVAEHLGINAPEGLTRAVGDQVTERLRKD